MRIERAAGAAARLAVGLLLALAATLPAEAAPKQWTVTQLPDLGTYGGSARSINNRGQVVGTSEVAQYYPHPVMWDNGVVTDLLAGDSRYGVANAINDAGVVAGTAGSGVMLWQDGVASSLGIAGEPADINKSGAVVGYYYPCGVIAGCAQRGFYYANGAVMDIGTLGNSPTAAAGVNDKGVVVGYSTLPFSSTARAVIWQDGVLKELGTLGGTNSMAGKITNHGVILGTADDPRGINHMVTWDVSGGLLHDYGPRLAGYGINEHDAIVGSNLDTGKPFLLEDGVYTWLLDLPAMRAQGWESFTPVHINDHGSIVGIGWKPGISNQGAPLLLSPK
jgi:probable HAF family extracellular repeat protein